MSTSAVGTASLGRLDSGLEVWLEQLLVERGVPTEDSTIYIVDARRSHLHEAKPHADLFLNQSRLCMKRRQFCSLALALNFQKEKKFTA